MRVGHDLRSSVGGVPTDAEQAIGGTPEQRRAQIRRVRSSVGRAREPAEWAVPVSL